MTIRNFKLAILSAALLLPCTPALTAEPDAVQQEMIDRQRFFQLEAADVEKAISDALTEDGAGESIKASLFGHDNKPVYASDKPLTVEIRTLKFDEKSKKWSANLMFSTNTGEVLSAMPVNGRYDTVDQVPVLTKRISNGTPIAESDIAYMEVQSGRMRPGTVTDVNMLIGKTPKRLISAKRPIRGDELVSPSVINKDSIVEMHYRTANMEIKTMGEALEPGGIGDVIRVRNKESKVVVQATVEGPGVVRVKSLGQETPALKKPDMEANLTDASVQAQASEAVRQLFGAN